MFKKVVIKIGTNVITQDDGFLDKKAIKQIVDQVAKLKKKGTSVVLVSSGAMGAGRSLIKLKNNKNEVVKRQALAAVGQIELLNTYKELLAKHDLVPAQVLASKEDFRDRHHYLNMKQCLEGLLSENTIPILNENDVVSVSELMFTDNDELAGLVAAMLDADKLILLTSTDGVYDRDPEEAGAKLVSEIDPKKDQFKNFTSSKKSLFGRGGMSTKCKVAEKCSGIGIVTHIVNGKSKDIILQVLDGKKVGTKFLTQKRKLSPVKKWIAHSEGYEKGVLHLNECAEPFLRSKDRAISLLPVGVVKIEGHFEKGDIVKIKNPKGKVIGLGKVEYGSAVAKTKLLKKGQKAIIHYDYLVLL